MEGHVAGSLLASALRYAVDALLHDRHPSRPLSSHASFCEGGGYSRQDVSLNRTRPPRRRRRSQRFKAIFTSWAGTVRSARWDPASEICTVKSLNAAPTGSEGTSGGGPAAAKCDTPFQMSSI